MDGAFEYLSSLVGEQAGDLDYDHLRTVVERDIVKTNKAFFSSIEPTFQEMKKLSSRLKEVQSKRSELLLKIQKMNEEALSLYSVAKRLADEREDLDRQTEMTEGFISRFQLTGNEMSTLESREVDESTLALLGRIDGILSDCESLTAPQSQNIRNQIVEQMNEYKEKLFEKIHAWASEQFHLMIDRKHPLSPLLHKLIRSLNRKEPYFSGIVKEFVSARSRIFTRSLTSLFTEGDRPLDSLKHDFPLYLTILLNWLHEECIAQQALAASFFTHIDEGDLLDRIMSNGCEILKDRFESSLLSAGEDLHLLQCSTRLLASFHADLQRVLPHSLRVTKIFAYLADLSNCLLINCVHGCTVRLLNEVPPLGNRLQPSRSFTRAVQIVREVCLMTSLDSKPFISQLLSAANMQASQLPRTDSTVLSINMLDTIKTYTDEFLDTGTKERVDAEMDTMVDSLVADQGKFLLDYLTLSALNSARSKQEVTFSEIESEFESTMSKMRAFIKAAGPLPVLGQCLLIRDINVMNKTMTKSVETVVETYAEIYEWLNAMEDCSREKLVPVDKLKDALSAASLVQ